MFRGTRTGILQRPQRANRRHRGRRVPDHGDRSLEALRPLRGHPARLRFRPSLGRTHARDPRPAGLCRSDCRRAARGAHRYRLRHTETDRLGGGRCRAVVGGSLGALRPSRIGRGQCRARLRLSRRRSGSRDGFHRCRRSRLLHCRDRGRRRNDPRRQERERVDVALLVTRRAQAEVDVRLAWLGGSTWADGSYDAAFVDVLSARHADRPQVDERPRIAERCLNRHGLAPGRHGPGEGDDSLRRSAHRAPARGAHVDATVLARRVWVRLVERERPQNRSGDRPRPRRRIRDGKRTRADE
jgi:hypothetical protein